MESDLSREENQAQEACDFWVEGREKLELTRQNPKRQGTQRQHLMQLPPLGAPWTPGRPAFPITHSVQQMTGKATLLASLGRVEGVWDGASKPEFQSLPTPWTFVPPLHTHPKCGVVGGGGWRSHRYPAPRSSRVFSEFRSRALWLFPVFVLLSPLLLCTGDRFRAAGLPSGPGAHAGVPWAI